MLYVNYKALEYLVAKRNKLVDSDIVRVEITTRYVSGDVSASLIFPNQIRSEDCSIFFSFLLDIGASFSIIRSAWRFIVRIKLAVRAR